MAFIHHLYRSSYCIDVDRQRIQEFTNFLSYRYRKRDRKYSECQLTFVLAPASNYSKQINIVPIVNISVRFVRQIIE